MYTKKIIISIAITLIALIVTTKSYATTGVINTETVKMRSQASTDSKIITLVSINDKVEIIEQTGEWYKVKFDGNTGYIYAKYIDKKEDKTKTENTQNNTVNEQKNNTANESTDTNTNTQTNTVKETSSENEQNTNNENNIQINQEVTIIENTQLKLLPLINSNNITELLVNSVVTVQDYVNGWYFVVSQDSQGWIRQEKVVALNQTQKVDNTKETESEETATEEKSDTTKTKYINVQKANLREKADKESKILSILSINTEVKETGTEGEWSKVEVEGKTGYILTELLSSKKVEEVKESDESDEEKQTTNRSLEESRKKIDSNLSNSSDVVTYAKQFLGSKYVSGGTTPSGFDCSGFTMYIFKKFGVNLSHSAKAQAGVGVAVEKSNLQLGDLVFFKGETGSSIGHVGIYVGGNSFIHASNPKGGVKITSLSTSYYASRYVTARRVL